MVVVCGVDVLSRDRPKSIRQRLSAVSSSHLHVDHRVLATRFEIAVAHDANGPRNRRDWTFASTVDSVLCNYRELWMPQGASERDYFLAHAYFHLLQSRGLDLAPVEIMAFHWHPRNATDVEQHDYARRPHFHFSLSPPPIPDSHLVSTLAMPVEGQASVEYLDRLLDEVVCSVSRPKFLDRSMGVCL